MCLCKHRAFTFRCIELSHVKHRIQNMEGKKLTKKSKNSIKTELNSSETKVKTIESGKVIKKPKAKKKAKLGVAVNGEQNKTSGEAVEMIQASGPAMDNVKIVKKKKKTAANKSVNNGKGEAQSNKKNSDKETPNSDATPTEGAGMSEAALKKIEKKKSKKAAQKLKKAQKKLLGKSEIEEEPNTTGSPLKNDKVKPKKKADKKQIVNKNKQKVTNAATTEVKKVDTTKESTEKDVSSAISDRVLSKKQRKTKRRQELKEQKIAEKAIRTPAQEEATVFVGNVPVNTKRVQLIRLFEKYGPVNSIRLRSAGGKILHKHKMRKAAGSLNAYVVLQSKAMAEKALELNGVEFKGVHLRVTKSIKESVQKDTDEVKRTIFVGNLKFTATEESLREIFSSCGDIEYVRCIRDGDKGCKGVAYVCFKHADAVGLALELKDTILDERPIHVERYSVSKLGAKEQRDAQAARQIKAAKNQKPKKGEKTIRKSNNKKQTHDGDVEKKSKKSEFRGVKVDAMKKKNKSKKIKNSPAMELAKKIAPKTKN